MEKKLKQSNPNMRLYEQFRDVPENARTPIEGGRLAGKTSINTMWRLKRLTEVFGPVGLGWNYRVTGTRTEALEGGQKALFVDIALKYKEPETQQWSEEIHGTGGNVLVRHESRSGLYLNDDAYKMAVSDAISNACKLLGLGADVYFENDVENKYSQAVQAVSSIQPYAQPQPQTPVKQVAYAEERHKPEMHKLHPQWNYSVAVIASSADSADVLRKKLETMYTITDANFSELLRLAGRSVA